jgi:hypothetical protein
MTVRQGFSILLLWVSIPLGVVSFGLAVFFGIDVVKVWMAPPPAPRTPLPDNPHPIEVVARGVGKVADVVGAFADGITKWLFTISLLVFAVAVVLFLLSRYLRAGAG